MGTPTRLLEMFRAVLPVDCPVSLLSDREAITRLDVASHAVRVGWVPRGWPHEVANLLEKVSTLDVVAGPRFSAGARELLRERGVGWVDQTGGASFVIGSIVVSRDAPVPGKRRGGGRPLWRASWLAVAEALLLGTVGTVRAIAGRTELATGTTAGALKKFEQLDLLQTGAERGPRSARRLTEPGRLLDAYAEEVERRGLPDAHVTLGIDPSDPVGAVSKHGGEWTLRGRSWAATGALAAAFQAPYLQRPAPLVVYVDAEGDTGLMIAASEVGLTPMKGGRLTIRAFPSRATARLSEVEPQGSGMCCVPWPRTYADLRTVGVRGEEAAGHLRSRFLDTVADR